MAVSHQDEASQAVQLEAIASGLCCDAAVTFLCPHDVLLCRSIGVVHELTVTTGIDRVTVYELLLA